MSAIACKNRSMKRVVFPDYYFKAWEYKFDTTGFHQLPELISNLEPTDTLFGKYNFNILPGYEGYSLNLKKNNKFSTYRWFDVRSPFRHHKLKGKWQLINGKLILKNHWGHHYEFIPYKHGIFIFLVPIEKSKYFLKTFDQNKNRIDSFSKSYYESLYPRIGREFRFLRVICFYSIPPKKS